MVKHSNAENKAQKKQEWIILIYKLWPANKRNDYFKETNKLQNRDTLWKHVTEKNQRFTHTQQTHIKHLSGLWLP